MSGLIVRHKGLVPKADPSAFIAANASIWFGVILRGPDT
jgi:hypothetical protein